jgi:hypothetical protein
MTTNSALIASLRSLRLRRLLAGASVLAFAAVAFTGSPAGGEEREKLMFRSNCNCPVAEQVVSAEIFMMNPDGTQPIRLTNDGFGDVGANLSPDGKGKIVFESNRIAFFNGGTPFDSDLFLINHDGTADGPQQPMPLTRGSSQSFDPTGKYIAFHRSASLNPLPYGERIRAGVGPVTPARGEPGGPTVDSDIFTLNLDDLALVNLTNGLSPTPGVRGDFALDDVDWSPDGKWIAFTSRQVSMTVPVPMTLGIYVMNLETKVVTRLTISDTEERSPAWSPDSTRIAIQKRRGDGGTFRFNIWVLHFDPGTPRVTNAIQLTDDETSGTLSPQWIPANPSLNREEKIVFNRNRGLVGDQIYFVRADGVMCKPASALCPWTQLTGPEVGRELLGQNAGGKWGRIAVGRDPK